MKQNPWFERFKELGQNTTSRWDRISRGKDHYEDTEGDLEAAHLRGKCPQDSFAMGPIIVCYVFGSSFGWGATLRAAPCPEPAVQSCSYADDSGGWFLNRTGLFFGSDNS